MSVEAREKPGASIAATASGTFRTPCPPDISQDVTFTVVTGQSYWDLDDPAGKSLEEIRVIRDKIESDVRAKLFNGTQKATR